MKTGRLLSILILALLFYSCLSYKNIELKQNALELGSRYKVKQYGSNKFHKGELSAVKDSLLVLKNGKARFKEIKLDGVQEIKKGTFSLGKTIALPVVLTGAVMGALWIAFNNTSLVTLDWSE